MRARREWTISRRSMLTTLLAFHATVRARARETHHVVSLMLAHCQLALSLFDSRKCRQGIHSGLLATMKCKKRVLTRIRRSRGYEQLVTCLPTHNRNPFLIAVSTNTASKLIQLLWIMNYNTTPGLLWIAALFWYLFHYGSKSILENLHRTSLVNQDRRTDRQRFRFERKCLVQNWTGNFQCQWSFQNEAPQSSW